MESHGYTETENEAARREGRQEPYRRVLGVVASPRGLKGATGLFYKPLLEGMEAAGASVETVLLPEIDLQPCSGCFACWFRGGRHCVIKDRMSSLVETIPEFDLLVLATPLYIDGMTAIAKSFLERMMPLNHPSIVEKDGRFIHPCRHPRMPDLALLAVCGLPGEDNFTPLRAHMASVAVHMHMPIVAEILRPETLSLRHPAAKEALVETLADLKSAGRSLVETGDVAEELLASIRRGLLPKKGFLKNAEQWWR